MKPSYYLLLPNKIPHTRRFRSLPNLIPAFSWPKHFLFINHVFTVGFPSFIGLLYITILHRLIDTDYKVLYTCTHYFSFSPNNAVFVFIIGRLWAQSFLYLLRQIFFMIFCFAFSFATLVIDTLMTSFLEVTSLLASRTVTSAQIIFSSKTSQLK